MKKVTLDPALTRTLSEIIKNLYQASGGKITEIIPKITTLHTYAYIHIISLFAECIHIHISDTHRRGNMVIVEVRILGNDEQYMTVLHKPIIMCKTKRI